MSSLNLSILTEGKQVHQQTKSLNGNKIALYPYFFLQRLGLKWITYIVSQHYCILLILPSFLQRNFEHAVFLIQVRMQNR